MKGVVLKLLTWLVFCLLCLILIWKGWIKEKPVIITLVFCFVMIFITTIATSRTYVSKFETENIEMRECRIEQNGDKYRFVYKDRDFYLDKSKVVTYSAKQKQDEMVEVKYEIRRYTPMAPDLLYRLYYLSAPQTEETMIVHGVNVSVVKE